MPLKRVVATIKRFAVNGMLDVALICALAFSVVADHGFTVPEAYMEDYVLVRDSVVCEIGPTGAEGKMHSLALAYERLKSSPYAVLIFKKIEKNGTTAGKAFALTALKKLDNEYFMSRKEYYERWDDEYEYISGCIGGTLLLRDLYIADVRDVFTIPKENRDDYLCIYDSDFFALGMVEPPDPDHPEDAYLPETLAFERLKISPYAVEIFKSLELSRPNTAKAYALTALKELDYEYFMSKKTFYKNRKDSCLMRDGCIETTFYLRDLYK